MKFIGKGRVGSILAASMLVLLAVQPAAAATTKFGAKLPADGLNVSNAYPGRYCDSLVDGGNDTYACTWILLDAYGGGADTAPRGGVINKVRIMNGAAGKFRVVVARKNASGQFKILSQSAVVSYSEDPNQCDFPTYCSRRTFSTTPLAVQTGDYIGIRAAKTSTLRCDSGGSKVALFAPPLQVGGVYTTPTDTDGCFLMVQAVYGS